MPLWLLSLFGWWKSLLSFFCNPPGVYIGAAAAVCIGLWWFGQHEFNAGVRHQLALDADAAANVRAGQPKILERIRTVYLPQEAKIKTVTQTITKEVPVYVTKQDDDRCTINRGFVRLHDSAAKSEIPPSPAGDDGAPSGVALSTVSKTVTGNYGIANLCATRLSEWQEWYVKNRALWDANLSAQ